MKIPRSIFRFYEHNLNYSLLQFRDFNNILENYLEREKQDGKLTTNNQDPKIEALTYGTYELDFTNTFPNILRASNLTSIITALEINLKDLCYSILIHTESPFLLKDLKGNSDFEKIKLVLKNVAEIDFKIIESEWNFIDNSRLIRNKFVHHQGVISSSHQDFNKITAFINDNSKFFNKYLDNGKYYHIKIEKGFISELTNQIFNLTEKLKLNY